MTSNSQYGFFNSTLVQFFLVIAAVSVAGIAVSMLPVRHTESPSFATPAFHRVWVSEASAATGAVDLWGSEPLSWRVEPYYGAPNDRRVVQYFERGRMEVESGSSTVTLGMLVRELTGGVIDLGDGVSEERNPPEIPIDSGEPSSRVPTYLTLSRLVGEPAPDKTHGNQRVVDWIDRGGPIDGGSSPQLQLYAEYIEETGHNLPQATTELFARPEFRDGRWIEAFGYPISEPYWTQYRRNEEMRPALIQAFERRILVYTPGFEDGRTFTVANSGRHYSVWRYGTEPHPTEAEPPEDAIDPELTLADDLEAWVYADEIGTPVDLALSPTGHLMILTNEGQILKAESLDPDGNPREFSVWADGIEEPQGLVTRGDSVLLVAAGRISWYRDQGGRGVRVEQEEFGLISEIALSTGAIRGKPVTSSAGGVFTRSEDAGDSQVLREIASDSTLMTLDDLLANPGPMQFADGDLILSGRNEDNRTSVVLVPSVVRSTEQAEPISLATFPLDTRVRAIGVANEEIWSITTLGDVLVAVEDEEEGRLFILSRHQRADQMEVIELVRGLSRPSAIEVGLDGSVYVADADQGRVIRIHHIG